MRFRKRLSRMGPLPLYLPDLLLSQEVGRCPDLSCACGPWPSATTHSVCVTSSWVERYTTAGVGAAVLFRALGVLGAYGTARSCSAAHLERHDQLFNSYTMKRL